MSKFEIALNENELPRRDYSEPKMVQIAGSRNVSNVSTCAGGQIEFRWQTGSNIWSCPDKTFLRVRFLKNGNATNIPSFETACKMFQSAEFRINDVVVSRIADGLAQVSALKKRLFEKASWTEAMKDVCNLRPNVKKDLKGEIIVNGTEVKTWVEEDYNPYGKEKRDVIWKLPLSVFGLTQCLPPNANYSLVLNPKSEAQIKSSITTNLTSTGGQPEDPMEIEHMFLMVQQVEGPTIQDTELSYKLHEIRYQAADLEGSDGLQTRTFNVSPSTEAVAIAVQDNRVINENIYDESIFRINHLPKTNVGGTESLEKHVEQVFVNYAGHVKPSPNVYYEKENYEEAYYNTQIQAGNVMLPSESYERYLKLGPVYYHDFSKVATDRSTHLQVNIKFRTSPTTTNGTRIARVLVFDRYTKVLKLKYTGGMLSDLQVEEV
jgi:hypothetical protein